VKPVLEGQEKTTPSIPPQKLTQGQRPEAEANQDVASMYIRHTGEQGDMVGPGEYDPPGEHLRQKGITINSSRQMRKLWEPSPAIDCKLPPKENPGPGSYEPKGNIGEPPPDSLSEALNTYQFTSASPMAHQVTVNAQKAAPGPGQYEVPGEIERGAKSARDRTGSQTDRTRFGGMSERVGWSRPIYQPYKDPYFVHNVPGPGHYPGQKSTFPADPKAKDAEKVLPNAKKKRFHGVHHPTLIMALQEAQGPLQAFNSTDDRACNREVEQRAPAPWHYNKEEARSHSMQADLRERAKVGRKGVFGTCADRFYGSPLEGRSGLPDPVSWDEKGSVAGAEPRCMFQSQSPRFHNAPGPRESNATKVGNSQTPAPGDYVVEREPSYRSPYRPPRQDHLSFGSSRQRFEGGKDVFEGHTPGMPNPGPGEYMESRQRNVPGAASYKAKRKPLTVGCTTEDVGPGSYKEDTSTHMLKKTFNVSTQLPTDSIAPRKTLIRPGL